MEFACSNDLRCESKMKSVMHKVVCLHWCAICSHGHEAILGLVRGGALYTLVFKKAGDLRVFPAPDPCRMLMQNTPSVSNSLSVKSNRRLQMLTPLPFPPPRERRVYRCV